jgi:hypothetical protein
MIQLNFNNYLSPVICYYWLKYNTWHEDWCRTLQLAEI